MKKTKIIAIILLVVVLVGLIIFASTHHYEDSHLRVDGIRVWVQNALIVDGCDEEDAIHCVKNIEVGGETQTLEFKFVDFKENGYPNGITARINDTEFYQATGLNIEENGSIDYQIFLNFNVINDEYIAFTFTKGTSGRTTTLYVIDTKGNIILEETEIDKDDMLIKDYTDFITYEDNKITLYATRVVEDINYQGVSICKADKKDIVEAYYTYTFKDGKFTKKQTETITAKQFIENKEIICAATDN